MSFDQTKYVNDYKREKYDVIRALIPKGKKAAIKECADQLGITVSALIVRALEESYNLDLSKD